MFDDVVTIKKESIGDKTTSFLQKGFKSLTSSSFRKDNPNWGMSVNLSTLFAITIASMYQFELVPYKYDIPDMPQDPPPFVFSQGHQEFAINIPQNNSDHLESYQESQIQSVITQTLSQTEFDYDSMNQISDFKEQVDLSMQGESFIVPNITNVDFGIEDYHIQETSLGSIYAASDRTGVGVGLLLAIASKESNFQEDVSSYSGGTAQGLFQFNSATWAGVLKQLGTPYGYGPAAEMISQRSDGSYFIPDPQNRASIMSMRDNPYHSSIMAAALLQDNQRRIESRLGISLNNTDKYLSHFLGVSDTLYFLRQLNRNPNSYPSAHSALSGPIRYNRNIFFDRDTGREKTFSQVYEHIKNDFEPRVAYYSLMYGSVGTPEHNFAREYIVTNEIIEDDLRTPQKM